MTKITIPAGAAEIIDVLKSNGFDAYVVGGCVRDSLLGKVPKDWDICTSAKPDEVIRCFQNRRIIETGLKHGTVTVVVGDDQYEVTTFRIDGKYSDNRRPDSVQYVSDVIADDVHLVHVGTQTRNRSIHSSSHGRYLLLSILAPPTFCHSGRPS